MNVAELIEVLKTMPQDAKAVCTETYGQWPSEINVVQVQDDGSVMIEHIHSPGLLADLPPPLRYATPGITDGEMRLMPIAPLDINRVAAAVRDEPFEPTSLA